MVPDLAVLSNVFKAPEILALRNALDEICRFAMSREQ
jgi:hypothetical protein